MKSLLEKKQNEEKHKKNTTMEKKQTKTSKQTNKKAKNQKKGGKEVFWLTIEGAKYMHDLPACYEKKNGKSSL